MKKSITVMLVVILAMSAILGGCTGKDNNTKGFDKSKLSSKEKAAIKTIDKLIDAFESRDVEAAEAIFYNPDQYEHKKDQLQNLKDRYRTRTYWIYEDGTEKELVVDITRVQFMSLFDWHDVLSLHTSADWLKFKHEVITKFARELEEQADAKLEIKPKYLGIHKATDCTFYVFEGLHLNQVDVAELLMVNDPDELEDVYVVEGKFPYYWNGELYGMDKEMMDRVFGDKFPEENRKSHKEYSEEHSNRLVIAYKYKGEHYAYMQNALNQFRVDWPGKKEE